MNGDVEIKQVSPIGGALAGGLEVSITGLGFQEDAVVYFGAQLAESTTVEDDSHIKAVVPSSPKSGTVSVTVVNRDESQYTLPGAFTYISMEKSDRAEVAGISPSIILDGIDTQVTLRGRNLVSAYNEGLLALRTPSRATLTISHVEIGEESPGGIESVSFYLTVSTSPPLQQNERIAIQVLASRQSSARENLIVENSKEFFTVVSGSVPVPIAYSPSIAKDVPTLVTVLGRNLGGCSFDFGDGIKTFCQSGDDNSLFGLITLTDERKNVTETEISILDNNGTPFSQLTLSIADSSSLKQSDPVPEIADPHFEGSAIPVQQKLSGNIATDLIAVPNQEFFGPNADDSRVYDLRGELEPTQNFIWITFTIIIADYWVTFAIINDVYRAALFDRGGPEFGDDVVAIAGTLFPVRGAAVLYAARLTITLHVTVVLIIGIDIEIEFPSIYNEFPEQFPGAIGTVVLGVIFIVEVIFDFGLLIAVVRPDGTLYVIFLLNLTFGIDFTISTDGRHLSFEPHFIHSVRVNSILPFAGQFPCNSRFQLADDNGQTAFADSYGGIQSYYFARSAGQCCVPWHFDIELVRTNTEGNEEVIQTGFDTSFCIIAEPSPGYMIVIITSVPPPQGVPPTLEMNIGDSALLKALAQPVDENGNPTGPPQDLRDLDYDVEFFLELPLVLLDPSTLPDGDAFAIQEGQNIIRVAITSVIVVDEDTPFTFWPGAVLGFDILRFLAEGQQPRIRIGGLPLEVNSAAGQIRVSPVIAYRNDQGELFEAAQLMPDVFDLERFEPFENQREYLLAVRLDVPDDVSLPQTLNFAVDVARPLTTVPTSNEGPLGQNFGTARNSREPREFFTGRLIEATGSAPVTASITITEQPKSTALFAVGDIGIKPNVVEAAASGNSPRKLVPPGHDVLNRNVLLTIPLKRVTTNSGVTVSLTKSILKLTVSNNETFEEYLRVFKEVQPILSNAGAYFRDFSAGLYSALVNRGSTPVDDILKVRGQDLWNNAVSLVQRTPNPYLDDRHLYWARLQSIGAIRAYAKRNGITNVNTINSWINAFELPSRGLDPTDGGIKFTGTVPAASRKVIITGFDPFGLAGGIVDGHSVTESNNPSGIIALRFESKTITIPDAGDFYVRAAMLPVRYRDFNNHIVENAITPNLNAITMLITMSQNGQVATYANYYDIERWACRTRLNLTDNNNAPGVEFPSSDPGTKYVETTLPFELVITMSEALPGPQGDAPFVIDQSYLTNLSTKDRLRRRLRPTTPPADDPQDSGKFRAEPLQADLAGHRKFFESPDSSATVLEGSGGSYLSNEIFYRSAVTRNTRRPKLASGHFHLPAIPLGSDPLGSICQALLNGVSQALNRFFKYGFRLNGPSSVAFGFVVLNSTSEQVVIISNYLSEPLVIGSVEVATPFSVELPGVLPITVTSGNSLSVTAKFTPTVGGAQTGRMTFKSPGGEILLVIDLSGEGIPSQPPPIITSFSPIIVAPGGTVTVTGQYFTRTMSVLVGNDPVDFLIVSDTQISFEAGVFGGIIRVSTFFGSASSSTALRIIFPRE